MKSAIAVVILTAGIAGAAGWQLGAAQGRPVCPAMPALVQLQKWAVPVLPPLGGRKP